MASLDEILRKLQSGGPEDTGDSLELSELDFSTILDTQNQTQSDIESSSEEPNRWLIDDTLDFDTTFDTGLESTPTTHEDAFAWRVQAPPDVQGSHRQLAGDSSFNDITTAALCPQNWYSALPVTESEGGTFPNWFADNDMAIDVPPLDQSTPTIAASSTISPAEITASSSTIPSPDLIAIQDVFEPKAVPAYMASIDILMRSKSGSKSTPAERTARTTDRKQAYLDMGQHAICQLRNQLPGDQQSLAALDETAAKKILSDLMKEVDGYNSFERSIRIATGSGTAPYTYQGPSTQYLYVGKMFFPWWMSVQDWVKGEKREQNWDCKGAKSLHHTDE